jgi:molybdate transport system substrate-binding protein
MGGFPKAAGGARAVLLALVVVLLASAVPVAAQPPTLVVSVAASIHEAMVEIAALYRQSTGAAVDLNTGSSSTLARQIVEGAGAGVFLSADGLQMDIVERAGRLVAGTRTPLLTNELAVVVPADAPAAATLEALLAGRLRRLAMGEPSSVPAGVYGRRWLEHEGAWDTLSRSVVPFPTVRGVLAAVEAGRVDAGIVYRTDAMTSPVRVIARVTAAAHPYLHIVQPAAVVAGSAEPEGRRFLEFLKGEAARRVFVRRGFGTP